LNSLSARADPIQSTKISPSCSLQTILRMGGTGGSIAMALVLRSSYRLMPTPYPLAILTWDRWPVLQTWFRARTIQSYSLTRCEFFPHCYWYSHKQQPRHYRNHPNIPNPPFPMRDENLLPVLKEFFIANISAINYTLAIVNNIRHPVVFGSRPSRVPFRYHADLRHTVVSHHIHSDSVLEHAWKLQRFAVAVDLEMDEGRHQSGADRPFRVYHHQ